MTKRSGRVCHEGKSLFKRVAFSFLSFLPDFSLVRPLDERFSLRRVSHGMLSSPALLSSFGFARCDREQESLE